MISDSKTFLSVIFILFGSVIFILLSVKTDTCASDCIVSKQTAKYDGPFCFSQSVRNSQYNMDFNLSGELINAETAKFNCNFKVNIKSLKNDYYFNGDGKKNAESWLSGNDRFWIVADDSFCTSKGFSWSTNCELWKYNSQYYIYISAFVSAYLPAEKQLSEIYHLEFLILTDWDGDILNSKSITQEQFESVAARADN